MLLLWAAVGVIAWIILYYVVKGAVKSGTLEALREHQASREPAKGSSIASIERPANPEQLELQARYDAGKISFEEYHAEWQRLA